MIPPHTKAIPLNRLPVVRKHGEALFLPGRRRDNEIPVKSGRRSSPLCPARRPMSAEPDAALPPRSAPRSEHAARWECSVSETPRAAADGDAATPRPNCPGHSAVRTKRRLVLWKALRPVSPPPHAASRTLFRTKKSVRSDAHYVGRTGLRLSPAGQGGALVRFARLAARCRPSQTRHCRRVVRLGANTLHGGSAACPKRRVRRRTVTRPPRAQTARATAPSGPSEGWFCGKRFARFLPHRTRHPGHFSGQRKVSVLMRTAWGGPGFASARRDRAALFPALPGLPPDAGRARRGTAAA